MYKPRSQILNIFLGEFSINLTVEYFNIFKLIYKYLQNIKNYILAYWNNHQNYIELEIYIIMNLANIKKTKNKINNSILNFNYLIFL